MPNRSFFLIQDSFAQIEPSAGQVATSFFVRLFMLAPDLRRHFPQEEQHQTQLFLDLITFVVKNLERVDLLLLRMQTFGHDLADMGVRPAHYQAVQVALLHALATGLPHPHNWCRRAAVGAWGRAGAHSPNGDRLLLPDPVPSFMGDPPGTELAAMAPPVPFARHAAANPIPLRYLCVRGSDGGRGQKLYG